MNLAPASELAADRDWTGLRFQCRHRFGGKCPVKWCKFAHVFPEFDHGVDAAAAVDGRAPSTAAWKTTERFPQAPTPMLVAHAIAAKISCAVAGSAGAVSCFIDSALK